MGKACVKALRESLGKNEETIDSGPRLPCDIAAKQLRKASVMPDSHEDHPLGDLQYLKIHVTERNPVPAPEFTRSQALCTSARENLKGPAVNQGGLGLSEADQITLRACREVDTANSGEIQEVLPSTG